MKFTRKLPTTDTSLSQELMSEGWTKLKEPSNVATATALSFPFMIVNLAISMILSYNLYPPLRNLFDISHGFSLTINLLWLVYIISIFPFMLIHELLHACFIPGAFQSGKTTLGINGLYGFVSTTEKITKARFIIISIMPFLLLSVILPIILGTLNLLNSYIIFLCLINSMGSSIDILNMCLIALQVPKGSNIISNGYETYYK